jgi:hypothetical protein
LAKPSTVFSCLKINLTLVSYNPKKGNAVLALLSWHETDSTDKNTGEKQKAEIVTSYNQTKGGADMVAT